MAMTNPLISVIMPVYNGEIFIRETIDTILNQTYRNFEYIIVNDGSSDSTQDIVNSYADERIVSLNLRYNLGVSNARNAGTDIARGEFIAFCDADDIYDSFRLEEQLNFLIRNPSVDVCGSYFIVLEDGHEKLIQHPLEDRDIKEHFFANNCIGQPSVMGKTSVFRKFKYNPELQASEDYDLWARMAVGGVVFANLPKSLVKYRLHPGQASKTKARLLYTTSKAVSQYYALACLDNVALSGYSSANELTLANFRKFLDELSVACKKKSLDMNLFRSLIALQYKKLDKFGLRSFLTLKMSSLKYRLDFPFKYLLNLFLLSFVCTKKGTSFFDTLTKLKL